MRNILAIVAAVLASPCFSHEAPSGWTYPFVCCAGYDCAPALHVTAISEGWFVEILPGEHPMASGFHDYLIPFSDERIKPSGDSEFHICINNKMELLCFFVPEGMFGV